MTKSITDIINDVLDVEGGRYTDDPTDHGGPTKWGITLHELSVVRDKTCTAEDVKALSRSEAHRILVRRYYTRPHFNEVAKQSMSVAAELVDTGVNMGVGEAGQFLQRALNVFNNDGKRYKNIAVDGVIGDVTLAALHAYLSGRPQRGEHVLLEALNTLQGSRYISICEHDETQERFAFGWFYNRVKI